MIWKSESVSETCSDGFHVSVRPQPVPTFSEMTQHVVHFRTEIAEWSAAEPGFHGSCRSIGNE